MANKLLFPSRYISYGAVLPPDTVFTPQAAPSKRDLDNPFILAIHAASQNFGCNVLWVRSATSLESIQAAASQHPDLTGVVLQLNDTRFYLTEEQRVQASLLRATRRGLSFIAEEVRNEKYHGSERDGWSPKSPEEIEAAIAQQDLESFHRMHRWSPEQYATELGDLLKLPPQATWHLLGVDHTTRGMENESIVHSRYSFQDGTVVKELIPWRDVYITLLLANPRLNAVPFGIEIHAFGKTYMLLDKALHKGANPPQFEKEEFCRIFGLTS